MDHIILNDEVEPLEVVAAPDDDERQYPEFVDKWDMLEFEDYDGDIVTGAQFEEADEEEEEENIAMGVDEQGEGDDVPRNDYDRDNLSLKEGSTFASMTEFRNPLATYCIKGEYDYVIDKSEPTRMTVHCAFERCQWRIHASSSAASVIPSSATSVVPSSVVPSSTASVIRSSAASVGLAMVEPSNLAMVFI